MKSIFKLILMSVFLRIPCAMDPEAIQRTMSQDYVLNPGEAKQCIHDASYLGKPFYIQNVKLVNAFMGGACSLHVFSDALKVNFHRIKFTEDGGFEHFVADRSGTSSRHYYHFPNQKTKLSVTLSKEMDELQFENSSEANFSISVKDGSIQKLTGLHLNSKTDYLKPPTEKNKPVTAPKTGILIDSGLRYGVDARTPTRRSGSEYSLAYSNLIDPKGNTCKVPHFFVYKVVYDRWGYPDQLSFLFQGNAKTSLDTKVYYEQAEHMPPKMKAKFLKRIGLIKESEAPKNETFKEFIGRYCPSLKY